MATGVSASIVGASPGPVSGFAACAAARAFPDGFAGSSYRCPLGCAALWNAPVADPFID